MLKDKTRSPYHTSSMKNTVIIIVHHTIMVTIVSRFSTKNLTTLFQSHNVCDNRSDFFSDSFTDIVTCNRSIICQMVYGCVIDRFIHTSTNCVTVVRDKQITSLRCRSSIIEGKIFLLISSCNNYSRAQLFPIFFLQ